MGSSGQVYINALVRLRGGEAAIPAFRAALAKVTGRDDIDDFQVIADLMAKRIPGANRAILDNAGHMANMDNPAAFNAAVLAFLGCS